MKLNPQNGIAVFTDGSASTADASGGWGWVAIDAAESTHTDSGYWPSTTNNQMELYAVANALFTIFTHFGSSDVLIKSDSQYVVLGCKNKERKRNKNHIWWTHVDEAIRLHQLVRFEHVKGHSNNTYNEMADKLAGDARKAGK